MTEPNMQIAIGTDTPLMGWEPTEAYNALLRDLESEHQPEGATEQHLVEELALTIWRRKRLQIAERVELLHSTPRGTSGPGVSFVQRHASSLTGLSMPELDPSEVMRLTEQDIQKEREELEEEASAFNQAAVLLESGKRSDYQKVIAALDVYDWGWEECADWKSDLCELLENVRYHVQKTLTPRLNVLHNIQLLRSLTNAYSYASANLVKLLKMDAALTKKFEQTLVMLARQQELRVKRGGNAAVSNSSG